MSIGVFGFLAARARAALIGAAALAAVGVEARAVPTPAHGAQLMPVLEALDREDWGAAQALAARIDEPAARVLATWRQLSRGDAQFDSYRDFLERHPDWPARDRLRARAEAAMPPTAPAADVVRFFEREAPLTGTGALRLAAAWNADGRVAEAREVAIRAWRELSLTPSEEMALLQGFGGALGGHHVARLDMLLWRGLSGEAERMLSRVDAGWAALARARLALRAGANGVNALIDRVPASLSDDPGLAYERFRWRAAKGLGDGAEEMIRAASARPGGLGEASAWADRRRGMARSAAREGRASVAYELASRHGLSADAGYDYADLEWIAGWVALRQLNDPASAERHFERFTAAVNTPISLGRGWYWLGRAREARGDRSGALLAYREGARHQTSFYGQLAAERGGADPDPALAGVAAPTDWRSAVVLSSELVRAGVMAHWAGDRGLSHWLLTHAARVSDTPRDLAALGALALELDRPEVAVRIAKAAARDTMVLVTPYYPVTPLAQAGGPLTPSVVMAIARQESELNPEAISPAGARGLMQLMPGTAQLVSRRLGIGYSLNALTGDWRYNARLGTDYLAGLMDEFGSLPLAAAGYNAGPGRVREWIRRFGDPRGRGEDVMVDWIETIPFNETRNYVQRVVEGVQIYDARISGETAPHRTVARLR